MKEYAHPKIRYAGWMIGLRWIAVTGVLVAGTLHQMFTPRNLTGMGMIALVVGIYNPLLWLYSRQVETRGRVLWSGELGLILNLQFALDILVLAVAVHLTGGVESYLLPVYLLVVPAAGLLLDRRATFLQVTLLVAVLGGVFGLEYDGLLAHNFVRPEFDRHLYADATYVVQTFIFHASLLYLGAYIAVYLGSQLRHSLVAEREARHIALTDGLTGLYNRRHFYQVLEQEVQRSRRHGRALSLLMLDLDNFKQFNDHYGHLAGDAVLCQLADLATRLVRQSDTVFRYGGEEFTMLLPETSYDAALVLAERLRRAVEQHIFEDRRHTRLGRATVSVGVATCPHDASNAEGLVDAADKALLRAKRQKNRVCAYSARKRLRAPRSIGVTPICTLTEVR